MTKMPYEVMAVQVELLYQREFIKDDPAIDEHCKFIAEFIRACGWTEEEYFERWMSEQEKENPLSPNRNLS